MSATFIVSDDSSIALLGGSGSLLGGSGSLVTSLSGCLLPIEESRPGLADNSSLMLELSLVGVEVLANNRDLSDFLGLDSESVPEANMTRTV